MFECRNCEGLRSEPVYQGVRDRFHGRAGTFNYVRCAVCGLVQIEEVPAELAAYYEGYRVHGSESSLYRALRRMTVGNCYIQPAGRGRSMLDFGAGGGWYLQAMARRGWTVTGYELDPEHAASLSQSLSVPVLSGVDALAAHREAFDLITLNFAFEHLDQPRRTLDLLVRCLKPQGMIYLSVPNIESREAEMFKDRWFHLDPPRHISFFSKQLLSEVLERAGFSDIEIRDLPVPTGFAGSLSYWLWNRFQPVTWYAAVLPGILFSRIVRDGNFAISARRAVRPIAA